MGLVDPCSLLSKPRGLCVPGFSPLSFGSDLALWLDPSYGIYTDRSTQLTAASSQHWSRAAASCVDLDIADNDAWVAGWSYYDALVGGVAHLGVGKQGVGGWYVYQFNGQLYADMDGALINTAYSTTGAWCFWMAYHDSVNDLIAISKNGGAFATAAKSGGLGTPAAADFRVGRYGTMYHDGRVDSVMFGKSPVGGIAALATTIRDYLYNSGSGRVYADLSSTQKTAWGLISAYDFDGDGLDSHGTNDLTAVNSPTYTSGIASGIAGDGDVSSLVYPKYDSTQYGPLFTPPSYAARPLYEANSQNGHPAIVFDGTNDYMLATDPASFDVGAGDFTLCLVLKHAGAGVSNVIFTKDDGSGSSNGLLLTRTGGAFKFWDGSAHRSWGADSSACVVITAIRSGTGAGQVALRRNGVEVLTLTDARTYSNALDLAFGASSIGSFPEAFRLYHAAFWPSNKTSIIGSIESYLMSRFGL